MRKVWTRVLILGFSSVFVISLLLCGTLTAASNEPMILVALLQGGFSGSASDWTDLKTALEKTYPNQAKVRIFPSGTTQASDVDKWIQSERSNNSQVGTKVVLIGHSRGANALVTSTLVADFVILIDPIDPTFANEYQDQS